MNCKGYQLARLVVPEDVIGCEHHGKIVWITTQVQIGTIIGWKYSGPKLVFEIGDGYIQKGTPIEQISDKYLRPIGNPGPEEVDETLLWKKVPIVETNEKKTPVKA